MLLTASKQASKMVNMEVEIVSSEAIKPSSPTPSHLRIFNLSLLDQLTPPLYVPVIYFYSLSDHRNLNINQNQILHHLKVSLSETLSVFYPLADRIKDHLSIDWNDEGVLFTQAKVNCHLSEILKPPKMELLDRFLPVVNMSMEKLNVAVQVAIQVNVFACGGISIGLYFLHRIIDATAIKAFLGYWAAIASGSNNNDDNITTCPPDMTAASLFPRRDHWQSQSLEEDHHHHHPHVIHLFDLMWFSQKENGTWRRFVFDAAAISTLKAKVASEGVPNPTRFQAVAGFVWKSAMSASRALGSKKPCMIVVSVSMRRRMEPPMSENSIGNVMWQAMAHRRGGDEEAIELRSVVDTLRGAIQKINGDHIRSLQGETGLAVAERIKEELRNMYSDEAPELYTCSSWCGLGFYDVDFGWGKPIWIAYPGGDVNGPMYPNCIVLMDTKSGEGIEALLLLPENRMAKLLCDEEFLTFVSINPNV